MTPTYNIHKHHSPTVKATLDWISIIFWGLFFFMLATMAVFFGPRAFTWVIATLF